MNCSGALLLLQRLVCVCRPFSCSCLSISVEKAAAIGDGTVSAGDCGAARHEHLFRVSEILFIVTHFLWSLTARDIVQHICTKWERVRQNVEERWTRGVRHMWTYTMYHYQQTSQIGGLDRQTVFLPPALLEWRWRQSVLGLSVSASVHAWYWNALTYFDETVSQSLTARQTRDTDDILKVTGHQRSGS